MLLWHNSQSISNRFFSVLFLQNRQGTSQIHVYAFQEGQYQFRRANIDSGGPIRIPEGQCRFRRANMDSVGPIWNRLWVLGRPIQKRLCILGGPIGKTIRNIMKIWVNESGRMGFSLVFWHLGLVYWDLTLPMFVPSAKNIDHDTT